MVNLLPINRGDGTYSLVNDQDPVLKRIRERTKGQSSPEVVEAVINEELKHFARIHGVFSGEQDNNAE